MLQKKFVVIFLLMFSFLTRAQESQGDYEPGQLWVKAKEIQSLEWNTSGQGKISNEKFPLPFLPEKYSITGIFSQSKIKTPDFQKLFRIEFNAHDKTEALIKALEETGLFEFVEKVPRYEMFHIPNDLDARQWNLRKIMAEKAWDIYRGNCDVVVAIVDDALDTTHPDLRPTIWRNTGEIPGNGIDDDGNGFIDDWYGWDAADVTNNPNPHINANTSFHFHGTHVGGITGAYSDNSLGIASIGYRIKMMPVKIGYVDSSGIPFKVKLRNSYQGVEYAIINKADIVNMSWGRPGTASLTEQMLYNYGHSQGIIFVAAAGNSHNQSKSYPAAYNHVITVGSTDNTDEISFYSKYGDWIDIMAPGKDIWSTVPGNSYDFKMGTSMAAPLVSGLIALMKCKNPAIDKSELINCLYSSSDDIDQINTGYANLLGAGRINAYEALKCIKFINADFTVNTNRICPGGTVQFIQNAKPFPQSVSWRFPGGVPSTSSSFNPSVRYDVEGEYDVELIVSDGTNSDTLLIQNHIKVKVPSAHLSGSKSIVRGAHTSIRVDLDGVAPFEISYSDGNEVFNVKNIWLTPYYIVLKPEETTDYELISVKDKNCAGDVTGEAKITIRENFLCPPDMSFTNFTGTSANELSGNIAVVGDYVYIVGSTTSNSFGGTDGLLIKYDKQGNLIWSKLYGGSSNDIFTRIKGVRNDKLLIGGDTRSYGSNGINAWFMLMDTSGSVIESSYYSNTGSNTVLDLIETSDKGYLIAGNNIYSSTNARGFIVKLDSNFSSQWQREINFQDYTQTYKVVEVEGVGFFTTHVYRRSSQFELAMCRFDYNGTYRWTKYWGGPYNDAPRGICVRNGSEIWVFGTYRISSTNPDFQLVRFDTTGNLLSASRFHTQYFEDGYDLIIDDSSRMYFTGYSRKSNGISDIKIVHVSEIGEIVWQTGFGTLNDDLPGGITYDENSLYVSGHSMSAPFGGSDILYSRIGCQGVNNCLTSDVILQRDTLSLTASNHNTTITSVSLVSTINSVGTKTISVDNEPVCPKCESNNSAVYNQVLIDSAQSTPKAVLKSQYGNHTIVVGQAIDQTNNNGSVSVSKVSDQGTTTWTKYLRVGNYTGNSYMALGEGKDNSIYISANSSSSSSVAGTIVLFKINSSGNLIWSKQIANVSGTDFIRSIYVDDSMNVYLGGGYGITSTTGNAFIVKLDSSGSDLWHRVLGNSGNRESIEKIVSEKDENTLYALCRSNYATGGGNPAVLKIKRNGQIQWYKNLVSQGNADFVDMELDQDSLNLFLLGSNTYQSYGNSDFFVIAADSSLNRQWSRYYGETGNETPVSISKGDKGLIIAGTTNSYDNNTLKQIIFSVDYDGEVNWTRIYGNQGKKSDFPGLGSNLNVDKSNGDVYVIYRDSTLNNSNACLSKLDNCANSMCYFSNVILKSKSMTASLNTYPYSSFSSLTTSTPNVSEISKYIIDTILCSFISVPIEEDTCELLPDFEAIADCINHPVEFKDITSYHLTQVLSWKWVLGEGDTIFGPPSFKRLYDTPGEYEVSLEIEAINHNNQFCIGKTTKWIVIPENLYVDYVDTLFLCVGDSALITNNRISCWEIPLRVEWSPSDGLSDSTAFEPNVQAKFTRWYKAKVTDRSNQSWEDSVLIIIKDNCCKSLARFTPSKTEACFSDSIEFINHSIAKNNVIYKWDFGSLSNIQSYTGANPPKIKFDESGLHIVQLSLSDSCGVDTFEMQIYVYPDPELNIGNDTALCLPDTIQIGTTALGQNYYGWIPGIGLSDSFKSDPLAYIDTQTLFIGWMIDETTGCIVYDSILISQLSFDELNLGNDTIVCSDSDFEIHSNLENYKHLWSTGDTLDYIIPDKSGYYSAIAYNTICFNADTVYVEMLDKDSLVFTLGNDTVICDYQSVVLLPNKQLPYYIWNTGANSNSITVNSTGYFWLETSYNNDVCLTRDSIYVEVIKNQDLDIGNDTTVCSDNQIVIFSNIIADSYIWNNGDTTQFINPTVSGTYVLTITKNGCSASDTIEINIKNIDDYAFSIGKDTILCDNTTITLQPDKSLSNPFWSTGETSQSIFVNNDGLFWLEEKDDYCSFRDSIYITRIILPQFSLGDSLVICDGVPIILSPDKDISQFNRIWENGTSEINRTITKSGRYVLQIWDSICSFSNEVYVDTAYFPIIGLPNDTLLCTGDTIVLNPSHQMYNAYQWQDGSNAPLFIVTNGGFYEVKVEGLCGDTSYTSNVKEVDCSCELYIPTAFSPNNDGLNDLFMPSFCELRVYKLEVFSRWGQKLFETNDILKGWDGKFKGKLMPPESYTWIITMQHDYRNGGNIFQKAGVVNMVY